MPKYMDIADELNQSGFELDLAESLQQPGVWERVGPAIVGHWTRRFEIHAWSGEHDWLDASYPDTSPLFAVVAKMRRLAIAVHLGRHENLHSWVQHRRYRDTSGTLLYSASSLVMVDVCIVKWELEGPGTKPSAQGASELSVMRGVDEFVAWLSERVPSTVQVNFVRPNRFYDVEAVGISRGFRGYMFLDPSVPDAMLRLARTKAGAASPHPIQQLSQEQAERDLKRLKQYDRRTRAGVKMGAKDCGKMGDGKRIQGHWTSLKQRICQPLKKQKPRKTYGLRLK